MNIRNKQERQQLIAKYLEAETSLAEERLLKEYFLKHEANAEEKAVAKLFTGTSLPKLSQEDAVSEKGAAEYDAIVRRKRKPFRIAMGTFACVGMMLISWIIWSPKSQNPENSLSPIEIAQGLSTLANMNENDIESMQAKPVGDGVIITVLLKNGETSAYMLTSAAEDGTLKLFAMAKSE